MSGQLEEERNSENAPNVGATPQRGRQPSAHQFLGSFIDDQETEDPAPSTSENRAVSSDEEDAVGETAATILGSIVAQQEQQQQQEQRTQQHETRTLSVTAPDGAELNPQPLSRQPSHRSHRGSQVGIAGGYSLGHATDTLFDDATPLIPITETTLEDIQRTLRMLSTVGTPTQDDGPASASRSSVNLEGSATGATASADRETLLFVKNEYEKLHKLFLQSRKNEQDLVKKCKDVAGQVMVNSVKVQAALKLSQNDRNTIAALKKEVKRAWKMVESAGEKEQKSKEAIARLKIEIAKMRRNSGSWNEAESYDGEPEVPGVNKMMSLQIEQEAAINALNKDFALRQEKEMLGKLNDQFASTITTLQNEAAMLDMKLNAAVQEKKTLETNLVSIKQLLTDKKTDEERNNKTRANLEITVKQLTESNSKKDLEITSKTVEIKALKESNTRLECVVKEDKARLEKETSEKEKLSNKLSKLQIEFDQQHIDLTRLKAENHDQFVDLKGWEDEMQKYKDEYRALCRIKDGLTKRNKQIEDDKMETEVDRDNLRGQNNSLTHERDNLRKQLEIVEKQLDTVCRERNIAQKNFVRATGAMQKQLNASKLADQTKRNLEQEISAYKEEAAKMRKIIYSLEKDRDRHINEASKVASELMLKDEDVKIKDIMLYDARKKIIDFERKLKEQQTLYENVRADRNLYSKNLIESQDDINEMKRKIKIMTHQIEQLKEEIGNKEAALAKESVEHAKLDKDKETLSFQIDKQKQQLSEMEMTLQNQKVQEKQLKQVIDEADAARLKQKKEYDIVLQERDILGTQLIRRNDEISLLYEKIKIQASTLNKGEVQYHERIEDIRVLKLEIRKLRREKAILQTETQNVDGLKNEIFKLQRENLREKTRVKVLEEELESPMNIHRWRKLSGSDPSTYELITKIQTLQRRLIAKTEEVLEKELIINQKEKLYKEVKVVLQRQPGPEVLEELRVVKDAVKSKMRECKSLASELNMYHSQVNEYKFEIDRLTRELQDVKKKFYEQKKREREELLRKQRHESILHAGGVVSERFTGMGMLGGLVGIYGEDAGRREEELVAIRANTGHTKRKYVGGGFSVAAPSLGPGAGASQRIMTSNQPPIVPLKSLKRNRATVDPSSLDDNLIHLHAGAAPSTGKPSKRSYKEPPLIAHQEEAYTDKVHNDNFDAANFTSPAIEQYEDPNNNYGGELEYGEEGQQDDYAASNSDQQDSEALVETEEEFLWEGSADSDNIDMPDQQEIQSPDPYDQDNIDDPQNRIFEGQLDISSGEKGDANTVPDLLNPTERVETIKLIEGRKYFKTLYGDELNAAAIQKENVSNIHVKIQEYSMKIAEKLNEMSDELRNFNTFKFDTMTELDLAKSDAQKLLTSVREKRAGAQKHAQELLTTGIQLRTNTFELPPFALSETSGLAAKQKVEE
ncbi:hypothetical protein HDU83_001692 [Entophlyctis luteolus]|nr:hypothetical protein HDU83_001692 [Entophlyctis luteolus]